MQVKFFLCYVASYNLCERIFFIGNPDDDPSINYFHNHQVMAHITVSAKEKKKVIFFHLKYLDYSTCTDMRVGL